MKKILLSLTLIAAAVFASAQCTPDPTVTSGMSPDTLEGMATAFVASPYTEVFTFVVPQDTTYQGQTVTISYVQLDDVTGLPSNFTYSCNPSNCQFPGGTKKCADVYSTSDPTAGQIGTYPLTILATPYVNFGFGDVSAGQTTYDGYYLTIAPAGSASVEEVGNAQMKSLLAYPNPTSGNTTIEFAMGYNTEVTFTVTNLLGEVVNKQVIAAPRGLNKINLDASNMSNGVYLYTITDGKNTISKKLIVNK